MNGPILEGKTDSRRESKTSSLSRIFGKSNNTLDVKVAGSQDKGILPTTRSFATEIFNYFNPYEKIPSNESFKLRASISTPDISESSKNPFVFDVENTKKDKEKTSNPVLMIFIIGGVTPSEIR